MDVCVFTSLEGLLRMSPTPPPLRSPWFNTVMIHMSRVSHTRSVPSSSVTKHIIINTLNLSQPTAGSGVFPRHTTVLSGSGFEPTIAHLQVLSHIQEEMQ